jgi:hypothetical protein
MLRIEELLLSLGAERRAEEIGDSYCFFIGEWEFEAGRRMSRWFAETGFVAGLIRTPSTLTQVDSELPPQFLSRDEGLAWLAEVLRGSIPDRCKPPWLMRGEECRHLLQFHRNRASEAEVAAASSREIPSD